MAPSTPPGGPRGGGSAPAGSQRSAAAASRRGVHGSARRRPRHSAREPLPPGPAASPGARGDGERHPPATEAKRPRGCSPQPPSHPRFLIFPAEASDVRSRGGLFPRPTHPRILRAQQTGRFAPPNCGVLRRTAEPTVDAPPSTPHLEPVLLVVSCVTSLCSALATGAARPPPGRPHLGTQNP